MEKFKNSRMFQASLRSGMAIPDYVIVDGIVYTIEEYDNKGKELLYGNLKHEKTLTIFTDNRYTSIKDATVVISDMVAYRNDISYIE